jgi:hypothetical protein
MDKNVCVLLIIRHIRSDNALASGGVRGRLDEGAEELL